MSAALSGVLPVLCTPFDDGGAVDEASLARLAAFCVERGADGVVCFGLAGEVYKLDDDERRSALAVVVDAVAGAVPVIAGAEHDGTDAAIARGYAAVQAGARALMLFPPSFVTPGPAAIAEHYVAVAEATGVAIVVQDAPAWTRVQLPVELLVEMSTRSALLGHVKVEAPPTSPKIAALTEAGVAVIGGFGALHLAEELDAGIAGFMPGCALPRLYADIWSAHASGDRDAAWALYAQWLPLLTFQMSSLDVFVAVQKQLLVRQGVITSAAVRRPRAELSAAQAAWLDTVLSHVGAHEHLDVAGGTTVGATR